MRAHYQDMIKLSDNYLFPEINKRRRAFEEANPYAHVISLSIGDTTLPIPEEITEAMAKAARDLSTSQGYRGYGPEAGDAALRTALAERLPNISPDEVFISDGAKCDIGRLLFLFERPLSVAVQDPSYPVYVDSNLLLGNTVHTLPCTPENNFFPNLSNLPDIDLIYICSPNNPTGAVATHAQLRNLVEVAHAQNALIIYDSAYAGFIQDPTLPRSIYEIEGAHSVAIEVSSFSKLIGFTGVRLGWSIVPKALGPLHKRWKRVVSTIFNGASCIAQAGGLAALHSDKIEKQVAYYMENARILKESLLGPTIYGGENAPYLWCDFGQDSWQLFQQLLEEAHLVTTPGAGFGPSGEGFLRLSAFATREQTLEAAMRLKVYAEGTCNSSAG